MMNLMFILAALIVVSALMLAIYFKWSQKNSRLLLEDIQRQMREQQIKNDERYSHQDQTRNYLIELLNKYKQETSEQRAQFDKHQIETSKLLYDSMQKGMKEISGQVDKKLSEGFEKTTATFTDVVKRLTIIDEAQKKIADLSNNVISLQEILVDKKSRGAFGEVQLSGLIKNMLPETHFHLQHTLSNGTRCDCILFLPEPTGNIAIDAKFPLETYQKLVSTGIIEAERNKISTQFARDIRKHVDDIASKYIIANETADGAVMFIPAEAIFAEIHAHHPEVVAYAQRQRVWMVSPTTMMAILTTARAVLKDADTRKQAHIIQEHLIGLSKDFALFQTRMENLAKHIKQAHEDVEEVNVSSRKIVNKFNKIEKVELKDDQIALVYNKTMISEE